MIEDLKEVRKTVGGCHYGGNEGEMLRTGVGVVSVVVGVEKNKNTGTPSLCDEFLISQMVLSFLTMSEVAAKRKTNKAASPRGLLTEDLLLLRNTL